MSPSLAETILRMKTVASCALLAVFLTACNDDRTISKELGVTVRRDEGCRNITADDVRACYAKLRGDGVDWKFEIVDLGNHFGDKKGVTFIAPRVVIGGSTFLCNAQCRFEADGIRADLQKQKLLTYRGILVCTSPNIHMLSDEDMRSLVDEALVKRDVELPQTSCVIDLDNWPVLKDADGRGVAELDVMFSGGHSYRKPLPVEWSRKYGLQRESNSSGQTRVPAQPHGSQ